MNTHNRAGRPPYGIIAVLMIGAFIAVLNNTLLNIALPAIMKELQIDPATVQWLSTGYMLVNGILVPVTAYFIQKYSVRRLFFTAMGLFLLGTIFAGVAHIFPILLVGRMLQASGSAILMPLLMNVMLVSFPVEKRGAAMGVFGLIIMFAPSIGPTLSGWIIEHYDWRMLFHFITPIAVIEILIGFFLLKDKKEKVNLRLDLLSLTLSTVGFGGILYGFSSAGGKGWGSLHVYLPIIVGVISLLWFTIRQLKQEKPMLNLRVYHYSMFTLSTFIAMTLNMVMFSAMILLPIYVQNLRGITPMAAGLLMLPGAVLMAIMSPITGKLFDKFGGRVLAIVGLSITVITTYYFAKLTFETSYTDLMLLYSIRSFGMSMVMMPVSTNGLNQLPPKLYPHGTAMNNTLNMVSGAIGTALLVTIMTNRTKMHVEELTNETMSGLTGNQGAMLTEMKQQIIAKATLEGINDAFLVATGIAAVGLILAFFIKRAKHAEEPVHEAAAQKKGAIELAEN